MTGLIFFLSTHSLLCLEVLQRISLQDAEDAVAPPAVEPGLLAEGTDLEHARIGDAALREQALQPRDVTNTSHNHNIAGMRTVASILGGATFSLAPLVLHCASHNSMILRYMSTLLKSNEPISRIVCAMY
jgi:hypothetical protein